MSPFRYRDDEPSSTGTVVGAVVGAITGFALGMLVAQRIGGLDGLTARIRRVGRGGEDDSLTVHAHEVSDDDFDDIDEDDVDSGDVDEVLEERVLEAFRNDPILAERAVDIGSEGEGVIELAGWVEREEEATHAVTLARGVPGVSTVVNRIAIGDEEHRFEDAARRFASGDPALTEAQWEGQQVGIGRRRQGTSDEVDRHADPKVSLESRWLSEEEALRNAAEDTAGAAERRARSKRTPSRSDRTGGAPVAPTGVPKADHVVRKDAASLPDPGEERADFGSQG